MGIYPSHTPVDPLSAFSVNSASTSGAIDVIDETDQSTALPCPNCGGPIRTVTVRGPFDGIVAPCGCRVPPDAIDLG